MQFAVDLELVADDADHGDPFTGPVLLLEHVVAVGLDPFDRLAVRSAGLDRRAKQHARDLVLSRAVERGQAVGVEVQRRRLAVDVEILRDPHDVLVQPLAERGVADALVLYRRDRLGVGELTLVLGLGDVLRDETPLRVRAGGVLDHRVHVDAERVADPTDADVLVERRLVAVLGQDADVALAVCDLVVTGCVIGDVGVRDVLDMPHHAVEDLGHLDVGVVVGRDDLAGRSVLPLLVGHLADVLRQLVDRQARPSVDRHALRGAAARKNFARPLERIVRRPGHKAQVVELGLPAIPVRANGHRHARTHGRQHFGLGVGLSHGAGCLCACSRFRG